MPTENTREQDAHITVVGLSHASAPLELLEVLADRIGDLDTLSQTITHPQGLPASLVLSTCSRLEFYVETTPEHPDATITLRALIAGHGGVSEQELDQYLYVHRGQEALRHLFTVAGGLDSVVVGEDQILAQIKDALERSQRLEVIGTGLNTSVQAALRVGKRIRTETGLNQAGRSLASAGLAAFERQVGSLSGKSALVIGAGSMGGVVVAALRRFGLARVDVANRTPQRAQRLAEGLNGAGHDLAAVPALLTSVDVVISCTAAGDIVVGAEDVRAAVEARADHRLLMLDLALPRNIDPAAALVPGAVLIDLAGIAAGAGDVPADDAALASVAQSQDIVAQEVDRFTAAQRVTAAVPVLSALRSSAEQLTRTELTKLVRRVPELDEAARDEISRSVQRIVDRLLHQPTMRARELAHDADGMVYVEALGRLFAVESQKPSAEVLA